MSKKDDDINWQLINNSGGANPEDYLTPKQFERYKRNPERFIDIDIDLVMNEKEEKSWTDARSGVRTGLGLGFEIAANTGLDAFSFIPGSQQAGSAFINYLAQKIRGGEVSKGEILAAAATSQIPGLAQARALTRAGRLTRSVAKGGISGGVTTTSMSLVDEGELPSFGEFATGVTAGGVMGGAFDLAPAAFTGKLSKEASDIKYDSDVFLRQLKSRVTGGPRIDHPDIVYRSGRFGFGEGTVGAARPIDPKDVPRNAADTWLTPGQKRQPLNFLFGEKAGWRGGRLNLKSWRERGADKNIAEQFLTAPGKGVVFSSEANKKNAFMTRIFGIEGAEQLLELPEGSQRIFQAHHKTATKAVLTGQEGLVYDSSYYHEIQKVWEDLELTLGNNPDNIIGTLGLVQRDLDSPHSLVHKFLDSKMGRDGSKFWTDEIMNQITIYDNAGNAIGHKNFDLRLAKTKEQALIFKKAVDLLKLAHRQYYLAKGVKPGAYLTTEPILDEEIVDSFVNKLPPVGGTGKYTTSVIKKIAKEIADETDITPTVKPSIQDVFDKQTADLVDDLYKFAVTEANGEDMLLDVLFEGLTPRQAINKWRKNDLQMKQLSIRFKKALDEAKSGPAYQKLKRLYQMKQGEIPPADTVFDKGAD
tara:strand:+ start:66 stop:1997 length:1932 start_codon:yes stop_codon:yes gene_type:complete